MYGTPPHLDLERTVAALKAITGLRGHQGCRLSVVLDLQIVDVQGGIVAGHGVGRRPILSLSQKRIHWLGCDSSRQVPQGIVDGPKPLRDSVGFIKSLIEGAIHHLAGLLRRHPGPAERAETVVRTQSSDTWTNDLTVLAQTGIAAGLPGSLSGELRPFYSTDVHISHSPPCL